MIRDLEQLAMDWHAALPGIARARLIDAGVGNEVIERHLLGWDGSHFTIPVRDVAGRIVLVETWLPQDLGVAAPPAKRVELFGAQLLADEPDPVVIAEGVLEALILQSAGFAAVSATGSGRYFKSREWRPLLAKAQHILVAFKQGPQHERRRYLLDRRAVVEKITSQLPRARPVAWPESVGRDGGAFEYFVQGRGAREALEAHWAEP